MFNFSKFILSGLLDAVGNMPDYWIILNATGWYEKGVLVDNDLMAIQSAIDEKNQRLADEEAAKKEAANMADAI